MVRRRRPNRRAAGCGDRRYVGEGLLAGRKCYWTAYSKRQEPAADRDRRCDRACAEGFAGGGGEQGRDLSTDGAAASGRGGVCAADEDESGCDSDAADRGGACGGFDGGGVRGGDAWQFCRGFAGGASSAGVAV